MTVQAIALPEGRLINHNLFVRDQFNDKSKFKYNVELAFDPDDLGEIEDALAAAAVAEWGGSVDAYWDGDIHSPILNGDDKAADREAADKPGDAYKGKAIIRAATIFNRHGQEDAGGAEVYDEDNEKLDPVNAAEIYQGCYGKAGVKIGTYINATTKQKCLMFYLAAFKKTRDGDRLVAESDNSGLFKTAGRDGEAKGASRRTRKG